MSAATSRIPQASLREEWAVAAVERWARALPRPVPAAGRSTPPAVVAGAATVDAVDPERAARRATALLKLAADPRAPAHERALAADRAAELLRRSA